MSSIRRISNSRIALRVLYYIWMAFPYPIRKPLTAWGIHLVLLMKKAAGVDHRNDLTPMRDLGNLSFWGVPEIDLDSYVLEIDGRVSIRRLAGLSWSLRRPAIESRRQ